MVKNLLYTVVKFIKFSAKAGKLPIAGNYSALTGVFYKIANYPSLSNTTEKTRLYLFQTLTNLFNLFIMKQFPLIAMARYWPIRAPE